MAPRRQPADASTLRRPAAASRSRSRGRVVSMAPPSRRGRGLYDRWAARNPDETQPQHELRLLEFYIFLLEAERERIHEALLEAIARNRRNDNNVAAARDQREALVAILAGDDATRRSGAPETRGSGP